MSDGWWTFIYVVVSLVAVVTLVVWQRHRFALLLGYYPCIMCGRTTALSKRLCCSLSCERELDLATSPREVPSPRLPANTEEDR